MITGGKGIRRGLRRGHANTETIEIFRRFTLASNGYHPISTVVYTYFPKYIIILEPRPRGVDLTYLCPDVCVKDSETDPF